VNSDVTLMIILIGYTFFPTSYAKDNAILPRNKLFFVAKKSKFKFVNFPNSRLRNK
jgi:hypothetical protein